VVRTYGLTHLSLHVKDLERTLAFYKRVFGAKVYWRGDGEAQVKTPGCHDVIAFEEKKRGAGKTGGINHFGFRLVNPKDIDKAVEDEISSETACSKYSQKR
jgi:catechol 2,3-dioxygenase-like lactoylglutathione lyase family enzyme